ncbi:MAG TPA: tRNA (guanine(46)-N(7))-methyltransferase TrmB [Rhizomicrobium sp.]|nr:tRNA (guanine(46)-N(7))-methyltransferase TrmB [Rhizomicrobium sp.]
MGSPGRRPISPTDSSAQSEASRRRGLLYGRRKGPKLSAHQLQLRGTLLPKLRLVLEPGADPRSCFSTSPQGGGESSVDDVWLEIGFGAGEHLLWQAEHHPRVGLIGAEPYEGGVAKLLSKLQGTENIRIHEGDAREIVDALPDGSIGRAFILFPDPWPKTRHHKRRFVQMNILDRLARVLKPGAELRFASDDAGYLAWTLERLSAHPAFEWMAECARDWTARPADWPQTRYEAKALHGPPAFLRFRRTATL